MDKAEHYKMLRDEARNTIWILYAAGFILGLVTLGTGIPISLILFAIGQCYYGPKYSNYENLYQEELSKASQVVQNEKTTLSSQANKTGTYPSRKEPIAQKNLSTKNNRINPEDLM